MSGSEGVLRIQRPHRVEIEADEGVVLYRRRKTADGWEWQPIDGASAT